MPAPFRTADSDRSALAATHARERGHLLHSAQRVLRHALSHLGHAVCNVRRVHCVRVYMCRLFSDWHELAHFFPGASLELVFVGPEISPAQHGRRSVHCDGRLVARCFHGTLGELLVAEPGRHDKERAVVVGFNTGFGNASDGMAKGGFSLMTGWLPDLLAILRLGLVAIFTCANDYSDLRGELAIWKTLLHASLVLPPVRNPFKAATVVRESNDVEVCEWSCSSCFAYAVCGCEDDSPPLPAPADAAALEELKRRLRKMGKTLAQTQTPSAVP